MSLERLVLIGDQPHRRKRYSLKKTGDISPKLVLIYFPFGRLLASTGARVMCCLIQPTSAIRL